jgi:hypothetical protein
MVDINDDVTGRPDTVLLPYCSEPGSLERPMRHDQQRRTIEHSRTRINA